MKTRLLFIILIVFTASATSFSFGSDHGRAAVVQLSGTIQPSSSRGLYSSGGITPEKVREINDKIRRENYEAVIYEINSGGGAVVASKEVKREIESLDIPKVCRFRDIAASGAYLFSLGCDRIVADSATITGSIGVKSSYLEFSEAMNRYGVDYVNISSGRYKELGSQFQNISDEEREILQEKSDMIHEQFLEMVKSERNITDSEHRPIRTGVIYLGSEAKKIGLVDRLGGRGTAKKVAENMTGKELSLNQVSMEQSFSFSSLLASFKPGNLLRFSGLPLVASY
ncbi:MAG: signal peptide peptidase SppA [Candidatus Nanosalina sp.]